MLGLLLPVFSSECMRFKCCTWPKKEWAECGVSCDMLDMHLLLNSVSFCSCIFLYHEYTSIREKRWAGLFYVICISEIVKEMPHDTIPPEANSLGSQTSQRKYFHWKQGWDSLDFSRWLCSWLILKQQQQQNQQKTKAVWNPSSFSLCGSLA